MGDYLMLTANLLLGRAGRAGQVGYAVHAWCGEYARYAG